MPSVFVVPIYVEVPAGFERAVSTLESYLRRAGYAFHMGEPMGNSEQDDLKQLADRNICPNCGKQIPAGKRQVYGGGVFCGLDCVSEYSAAELIEKHKKRLTAAERHRNS